MFFWFRDDDMWYRIVDSDVGCFHGDDFAWDAPSYHVAMEEYVLIERGFVGVF